MSEVPAFDSTASQVEVIAETTSIWGYVAGGVALLVLAGFWGYRKLNTPRYTVAAIRRKNAKEMKKQGLERTEVMVDLDELLDAVQVHAEEQGMKGTEMAGLLSPINDKDRIKDGRDMYMAMSYIAKEVGNPALANQFQSKAKMVKSGSKLMAGLFKRAGI
uniref:hypothetical protein n=1 Tax=Thaumasiovibrio occultus TaxID=1891184 RepID=UPI000B35411D|nr:hypothetical protein [Thaumasiovibrio occultus]